MDRIAYGAVELDVTDIGRSLAFLLGLVGVAEGSRGSARATGT